MPGEKEGQGGMGSATQKIDSLEALSKYFSMPEKMVAKELGICLTSLKKMCRGLGITRWPFRKVFGRAKPLRCNPECWNSQNLVELDMHAWLQQQQRCAQAACAPCFSGRPC